MNHIFIVAFTATIFHLNLIADEPSAFGAGDITQPNPYGLTSKEAILLENKKKLHKVVVKSNTQADEVESLKDRMNGLQGLIESLTMKSHENKLNIKRLDNSYKEAITNSNEYEKRFSDITQKNGEIINNNLQSIETIKLIMTELSSLIDTINATYVTKDEFNTLVNDVNKFKDLVSSELKKTSEPKKSKFDGMSKGDIATKARALYNNKKYVESIEYYKHLIDVDYKPARGHYMIGEMRYYRKEYADAIAHFKKSASLYKDAKYMPTLMLHTARAMELTGDKKNAKAFYKGILVKFPETKYAKEAEKYLALIK